MPEIMFFEEDESPRPPQPVRITQVQALPLPDGRRVTLQVTLTPFIESPSFDVTILRLDGAVERTLSVIGAMDRINTVTLHLRRPERAEGYVARVELLHDGAVLQTCDAHFVTPAVAQPQREQAELTS